jgi:hypothetical protein
MTKINYSGYRFPPEIIQQAIWLYVRFTLSFRDVEDLLAERGIIVSYETVRRWVNHFGPKIAADLRKRRPKPHSIWHPPQRIGEAHGADQLANFERHLRPATARSRPPSPEQAKTRAMPADNSLRLHNH